MYTVRQIRETLELSYNPDARSAIVSLNLAFRPFENTDMLPFDFYEHSPFYSKIYENISIVLENFRKNRGNCNYKRGITISEIGNFLDKMGEPWPSIVIATAIQYQLLNIENKFYPIQNIMKTEFANLDVRQSEQLFHCAS